MTRSTTEEDMLWGEQGFVEKSSKIHSSLDSISVRRESFEKFEKNTKERNNNKPCQLCQKTAGSACIVHV